jgi:hypothetical protein
MEDNGMPADHSLDGNDIQATHVVAYARDEPVGALRIRWFKDFAKLERSAFRRSHRNPRCLRLAAQFVFGHIARKGYPSWLLMPNCNMQQYGSAFWDSDNQIKRSQIISISRLSNCIRNSPSRTMTSPSRVASQCSIGLSPVLKTPS